MDLSKETGLQHRAIKFYFYTQAGNSLTGSFRNLAEVVLVAYLALHLNNWWYIPLMALAGIPTLALIGWYSINYMAKVMEKLSIRQGTYYAKQQFDNVQETLSVLKEIRDKIK